MFPKHLPALKGGKGFFFFFSLEFLLPVFLFPRLQFFGISHSQQYCIHWWSWPWRRTSHGKQIFCYYFPVMEEALYSQLAVLLLSCIYFLCPFSGPLPFPFIFWLLLYWKIIKYGRPFLDSYQDLVPYRVCLPSFSIIYWSE